jgi:hypothetical protein
MRPQRGGTRPKRDANAGPYMLKGLWTSEPWPILYLRAVGRRRAIERLLVERRTHPLAADAVAQVFDRVCVTVERELALFFRD